MIGYTMLAALGVAISAYTAGTVSGRVTDARGEPLPAVRVTVVEAKRSTATDDSGRYRLPNLPNGTYAVTFHGIGLRPLTRRVEIAGEVTLDVRLERVTIELPAVQVTATADAGGAALSPQPVSLLLEEALRPIQAASVGIVIAELPGVRSINTGQGIAKPVIRGLSSNRVLVADDGMRLENQQWGDEHAPQVETLDADRIEVIRGPASVLYGSDALGGVVNVIPRQLPDAVGRTPFVNGRLTGSYGSGAAAGEGGLLLEGATGGFGFRTALTGRRAGDVATPAGELFNSGVEGLNASGTTGLRGAWGHAQADFVHRTERIEIHEDPAEDPTATPYQRIQEDRGRVDFGLPLGRQRLDLRVGYERNKRREFEDEITPDVAVGLTSTTLTGEAHLHHGLLGADGVVGLSAMRNTVDIFGEETLVPASEYTDVGLFIFEQRGSADDPWQLSGGVRFDARRLTVEDNADLGVAAQTRDYDAFSGNLGILRRLTPSLSLVANVGRAWRAPNAFELFANGVHEGTVRFERGDSTLDFESSLNLDAALRWQSASAHVEAGAFVNRISDYIYIRPTGVIDPASGFEIFEHLQGDAILSGLEVAGRVHPTRWLDLSATADYVYGQNQDTDAPLPAIPPFRISATVRFEPAGRGPLTRPYLSVTGVSVAALPSSRVDPNEFATKPYQLVHLGLGTELAAGSQVIALDLTVQNLLDEEYRDFLSRYKRYASEIGRNAVLRLTVSF